MRCAIETCRSSLSVFSVNNFKLIYDIQVVHLLVYNIQWIFKMRSATIKIINALGSVWKLVVFPISFQIHFLCISFFLAVLHLHVHINSMFLKARKFIFVLGLPKF